VTPALLRPLGDRVYRRLFSAQVIALIGTGLTSVALALLAYDLAGDEAGVVVGIALALKMVAYITVSPLVAAWARGLSRRGLLVSLDLARASVVLLIPFVDAVWQVYVLIFLLNACSAGFTPTFQAVIPDVLPDEQRYTEALSLSRLAYDLEGLLSPVLAAALLGVVSYSALFVGNGLAFLASASLVVSTVIPQPAVRSELGSQVSRVTYGIRLYFATPRLRGLFALNLAVALAGAMVIVNTVIYVREDLGLGDSFVAWGLGAAGAGSMVTALLVPALLARVSDRTAMLAGAGLLVAGLFAAVGTGSFAWLIACWFVLGAGMSLVQTPVGRLILRSSESADRPALFAAQFSLSHFWWLVSYPAAGILGGAVGLAETSLLAAILTAVALLAAVRMWPRGDRSGQPPRDMAAPG
jgi:MFS family permease